MDACPGKELCQNCSWHTNNRGYCSGCDSEHQKRCIKRICYSTCDRCGGMSHASIPGCCGYMPSLLKERWNKLLDLDLTLNKFESPKFNSRLIPVIHSIRMYDIPSEFPEIDAWLTPIHKVSNRKGKFYSQDLKDYLGLSANHKLILSTCAPDDYQEILWKKGSEMNFEKYGVDYWFPAHFFNTDDDSKMYQLSSFIMQISHAKEVKSPFVWFRFGKIIPLGLLERARNIAIVLLLAGHVNSKSDYHKMQQDTLLADHWFPEETPFFLVGGRRKLPLSKHRICYETNSSWLIRGLKGYSLQGQQEKSRSKREVLVKNLKLLLENNKL